MKSGEYTNSDGPRRPGDEKGPPVPRPDAGPNGQLQTRVRRLAWLPIPLLLLMILALRVADVRATYDAPQVGMALNFIFGALASAVIVFLVSRSFLAQRTPGLLLLGCGMFTWGLAGIVANTVARGDANLDVTIHNLGVWLAALFHFVSVLLLARPQRTLHAPRLWLGGACIGVLVLLALIAQAALQHWTPTFFVPGTGGTLVRQFILGSAVAMFFFTAWLLQATNRQPLSAFGYWYALGLASIAVGLCGILLQATIGGLLPWAGRAAMYLSGVYMVIAALASARAPGAEPEELELRLNQPRHQYVLAIAAVLVATAMRLLFLQGLGTRVLFITFYPAVILAALYGGFRAGMLATLLSAALARYFWLEPVGQFSIKDSTDGLSLAIFLLNCVMISWITQAMHRAQARAAKAEAEARIATERAQAADALRDSREALRRQAELIDPVRAELIAQEMQRVVRERGAAVAAPPSQPVGASLRRVPVVTGAIVAGAGLLVFIGWILGLAAFKSVLPGLATMKANTAVCFLLSGAALLLLQPGAIAAVSGRRNASANETVGGQRPPLQWAGMAAAVVVLLVAGLTMLQYVTGVDFGIDQLLFRDTPDPHTIFPGRMVEATALAFLFTGSSLLLLSARSRAGRRTQQTLAVCAGVIGVIALLGYAYNVRQLYHFAGYSSMALHTAASFLALAVGLICARPDGLARVLTTPGPAAQFARRFLPVALLAPPVLGWLVDRALKHGLYGEGMDLAMLTLAMMLSLAALGWWTLRALHRADTTRRENETQLRNQAEVMDHAHDALIVCELDGVIRSWNHGAETLYGWSAAEAVDQTTHDLLHAPARSAQEIRTALEKTGRWEGELLHTARDGRRVTVESRKTATRTEDGRVLVLESNRDITEHNRAEQEREITKEFLRLVNATVGVHDLVEASVRFFRKQSGCEALGIRLREGDDYPYYETHGFPEEFVRMENSLCVRCEGGGIERDSTGNPALECMCGNVICGRFDPAKPFFTAQGSFWANDTTRLLATTTDAERQARTRNRCNGEGYESVALVALRAGEERLGLLQLNDRRKNMFTPEVIALWERLAGYLAVALARARAEEQTARERAQLASVFESVEDGICVFDMAGKVVLVNEAQARILGYPDAQAMRKDISYFAQHFELRELDGRIIPVEDWPSSRVLRGERVTNWDLVARRTDTGQNWFFSDSAAPVHDSQGRQILGVVTTRDITSRKQAEAALRASETRLSGMVSSAMDAIVSVDADHRIVLFNAAAERMFGYRAQDAVGQPLNMLLPPERRAVHDQHVRGFAATGVTSRQMGALGEVAGMRANGEQFPIEASISQIEANGHKVLTVILRDITERKQAEKAVRQSEEQFRALAETITNLAWWANADGYITWYNRRWYEYTGTTPQQMEGWGWQSVHDPQALPEVLERWKSSIATGEPFDMTFPLRGADGKFRRFLTRIQPVKDEQGRVVRWFGTNTDVEELKRAEEAVRQTQQTLMELIERSPFGTYIVDSQFRIAMMNASSQSGAFRNVRPVVGRDFGEAMRTLWPEPVAAEIISHFRHTLDTGEPYYSPPFINPRHDVEIVEAYEWELHRMSLPDGQYGVICYYYDSTKLRKAEQAQRQSEERLRFALESCAIGAWDMDLVDHTAYRSLEHDRIFGYQELLPQWTLDDFLKHALPEYRAEVETMVREATAAKTGWTYECQIRRADGEVRWIWFSGQHRTDGSGRSRVSGVVQDITARKQAEAALRESEERFRLMGDTIPYGAWMADAEGRNIYISPWFLELVGMTFEQVKEFGWTGKLLPEDVEPTMRRWTECVGTGRDWEGEMRFPSPDGQWHTILSRGKPVRDAQGQIKAWVGINLDITSRKQAEEALRASESFYRQTLESIPGMVFTTRPDGYCDYQSQQWVDFTGVPMAEHLGDGWNKLQHPDDRPRSYAAWNAAVQGKAPYDLEYRVRRHDGVYEWFKVIGRPIRDGSGQIVRWFGVALNIQGIKDTEESIAASLREKEVMLKEIHHRVKNNLQVISSLVDLQTNSLDDPALRGLFQDVRNRVRSMALVHEKLYQSENLAGVDFADYTRTLIGFLSRAHGRSETTVRFKLDLKPVSLPVETAVPCGLILNELVTNAFKHAFRGRAEGEVTATLSTGPDGRVCLRVSDDGVGLPAGINWRESRTLGLQLIHLLAGQLDATVEVRTGVGTEFLISFKQPQRAPAEARTHA